MVLDASNLQYETEIGITHVIPAAVIRTDQFTYPATTWYDRVCQLGQEWDSTFSFIHRDAVLEFTGTDPQNGFVGWAADYGGICSSDACPDAKCERCGTGDPLLSGGHYCSARDGLGDNFAYTTNLVAHELGHLWSAQHYEKSDPPTTMSTPINESNTFAVPIRFLIFAFTGTVDCLECTGIPGSCGSDSAGGCYTSNASPFCDDAACCQAVCAVDDFCCDDTWDELCADLAIALCSSCEDAQAGPCLEANGSAGCDDVACCNLVCLTEPYCCETLWDGFCVAIAAELCLPENPECAQATAVSAGDVIRTNPGSGIAFAGGASCAANMFAPATWFEFTAPDDGLLRVSTCGTHDLGGIDAGLNTVLSLHLACPVLPQETNDVVCNDDIDVGRCGTADQGDARDALVELAMAAGERILVRVSYDGVLQGQRVAEVAFDFFACGGPTAGSCYVANDSPACNDGACCDTVCAIDPFCCDTVWDAQCIGLAVDVCAPCTVMPDDGMTFEDEEDCGQLGENDTTNGGCDHEPFLAEAIACGEQWFGSGGSSENAGDSDWYELPSFDNLLLLQVHTEFDARVRIVEVMPGCTTQVLATRDVDACQPDQISLTDPGDGFFYAVVETLTGDVPCGRNYTLRAICGPIDPPNPCPADIDGDDEVGFGDLVTLLSSWGPNPGSPADFDENGTVDFTDLVTLLSAWGPCP